MKKRIMAFLAALVMLLSCVPFGALVTVQAAEELILKLHYHRADGQYDGWDVWLWEEGKEGAGYPFENENGEMVATKVLTPGTTAVGFIVRTQDWTKDIGEDQFIDIAEMVSGTVHIYVESGVKGYTKEYGEDAVTGVKLSKARYNGEGTIITKFTGEIATEDLVSYFKVNGPDGEVAIKEVKAEANNEYHLVLAEELNGSRNYTVFCDGTEYKVVMPIIFSTDKFEEQYTYTGKDLGATYSKDKTSFRVWAPTADKVALRLYQGGQEGKDDLIEEIAMTADVNGTWVAEKTGDLNGTYYTYFVTIGDVQNEACDPYARTTGVNGKRAMVIDLDSTDPEGWENDKNPNADKTFNDAVIYELHVRDLSIDKASGIKNRSKYLAFTETGTVNSFGQSTGVDYLKKLGVTHIHLLPTFDYASVDETKLDKPQFNWGYDPQNFNMPEGSYSTDPYNGEVRVKEFKQMVQSLHNAGMSVVMDVVYGHVANAGDFSMNRLTPNYYSRPNSSASGCGNDTATERSMNRKFIVDSFIFWATEYHIDGFRIDQQGLFDIDTINEVVEKLHAIDPSIIIYGEGWNMNSTNITKPGLALSNQSAACDTIGAAYFSDSIRDGIKGSVFDETPGYITGGFTRLTDVINAVIANPGWQWDPNSVVNYNSCHDNYSLFDRILITDGNEEASFEEHVKQNNLAAAIVYTSQGIPFMQAGEEILRTKPLGNGKYEENSYCSNDAINSIKWDTLNEAAYQKTFDYYKGLIEFRKAHAGLRMATEKDINDNLTFLLKGEREDSAIAYMIKGGANGEASDGIVVIYNPSTSATKVDLPEGEWGIYVQDDKAGNELLGTATGSVTVNASTATVLVKNNRANGTTNTGNDAAKDDNAGIVQTGDSSTAMMLMVVVALGFAVVAVIAMKKKNELN